MNAYIIVAMAAVVGPELDNRIKGYEDGTLEFDKSEVIRDLRAATNLASLLSLELERVTHS